jgi:hypothetical protein
VIAGLYSIFQHGVALTVDLKIQGLPITKSSAPLVLANSPGRLSYEPIEAAEGSCACAGRQGSAILPVLTHNTTSVGPFVQVSITQILCTFCVNLACRVAFIEFAAVFCRFAAAFLLCFAVKHSNRFPCGWQPMSQLAALDLLSLAEMKALSCLCTLPQLNASQCIGCCRPLCWHGE